MVATDDPLATPVELHNGLLLRRATPPDSKALVAFNADVHRAPGTERPSEAIAAWTRDLLERPHPTFQRDDFTVVEDTRSGAIVSCLNLIPQTWSYGGVRFGVGRVEFVGTHPEYRRRGLVRRQFEVIHRWSAAQGHLVQAITGIPWFYRQFGYELALALGGGRGGYRMHVPPLEDGAADPFRVRPAAEADIPFITNVEEHARRRYLVTCVRDAALWRYELSGRSSESVAHRNVCVIETAAAEPVGYVVVGPPPRRATGDVVRVTAYELAPGVSWLAATPSVLRYLDAVGPAYEREAQGNRYEMFLFNLGTDHPVYRAIPNRLLSTRPSSAFYLRVPDLAAFLRHVSPILESRLAASDAPGHSGELTVSFYRSGLRLRFNLGRLESVDVLSALGAQSAGASFPELTFLQLLFGYRSLAELEYAFADCRAHTDEARLLLDVLFPKQPSLVWPLS